MEILVLISFVLLTNAVSTSTPENFRVKITKSPKKSKVVLIGSKINLQWEFEVEPPEELQRIFLFRFNSASKAKHTIASKTARTTSSILHSPLKIGSFLCEAYVNDNGVGSAWIVIENIQFNYSGNYGIGLVPRQDYLPTFEKSMAVKVVDMIADEEHNLKTVRSWIGHKTLLKCEVRYRAAAAPNFKWLRKSTKEIITKGIVTSDNTSILAFERINATDFGEYICKAWTNMNSVVQNFLIVKLDYSVPPHGVKYTFYKESGIHTVFWKQAVTENHRRAREYVVQIMKPHGKKWSSIYTTEKLLVSLRDLKSSTKLRVCSANEIGYHESSCSKPIDLVVPDSVKGSSEVRGKSSHFQPCQHLILALIFMSSYITLRKLPF